MSMRNFSSDKSIFFVMQNLNEGKQLQIVEDKAPCGISADKRITRRLK